MEKIYGFQVGKRVIDIEANSEQEACSILVKCFWDLIDSSGQIELLGELNE